MRQKPILKYVPITISIIVFILVELIIFVIAVKTMANLLEQKPFYVASYNIIFSFIVAISTLCYAMLSYFMWQEMRKTRERLDEPNIQISLESQARWGNFFDIVIENLGNVSVYNLKLSVEPKDLKTTGENKIGDINLFKKPIPVFGLKQQIKTFAFSYPDFINSHQPKQISFSAEYETKNGNVRIQRYDFDMDVYFKMPFLAEKTLDDLIKPIENLAKDINQISSIMRKDNLMKELTNKKLGK